MKLTIKLKQFNMKIFDKKFKVKVTYFAEDKYKVKYSHYRFIPIWYAIIYWFNQGLTGGTEGFFEKLFEIEEAEKCAKKLKSIEDVREWHKPEIERKKKFYKRQTEYYKKAVPYISKKF